MRKYSISTELVWKISSIEAQHLKHKEIELIDLMIGLLKVVDVELEKFSLDHKNNHLDVAIEIDELRQVFIKSGIDSAKLRRQLRRETGKHHLDPIYKNRVIHRSDRLKEVFKRAELNLESNEEKLRPIHLLTALLEKHEEDLERLLLLIDFPLVALTNVLYNNGTGTKHKVTNQKIVYEESEYNGVLHRCRAAIGYIELSMLSDAEKELEKIPLEKRKLPLVQKLFQDIILLRKQ